MNVGEIKNHFGSISINTSAYLSGIGKLDVKLALEYYGFLVTHNETISTIEWIKRIRKTYVNSPKRNHLIRAIINASRKTLPKRLINKGNYTL